jgi:hypothetical protein
MHDVVIGCVRPLEHDPTEFSVGGRPHRDARRDTARRLDSFGRNTGGASKPCAAGAFRWGRMFLKRGSREPWLGPLCGDFPEPPFSEAPLAKGEGSIRRKRVFDRPCCLVEHQDEPSAERNNA